MVTAIMYACTFIVIVGLTHSQRNEHENTTPTQYLVAQGTNEGIDICNITFNREDEMQINCSRTGISHIPKLPGQCAVVDLAHNEIEKIFASQLKGLSKLYVLDISNNPLIFIEANAFNELNNLSQLFIRYSKLNQLNMTSATVDAMISELTLIQFAFTYQTPETISHCVCPVLNENKPTDLKSLIKIRDLEIDSKIFSEMIKSGISNADLWTIQRLEISNTRNCYYKLLGKTCFPTLTSLRTLIISSNFSSVLVLPLQMITVSYYNNTFENLENLESLQIDQESKLTYFLNGMNLTKHMQNISSSVAGLKHFRNLTVRGVRYGVDPHFSLGIALSPLLVSTSLVTLDMSKNGIIGSFGVWCIFPSSLKVLILRKNCQSYLFAMYLLYVCNSLEIFDAKDQNYCLDRMHKTYEINNASKLGNKYSSNSLSVIYTHSVFPVELSSIKNLNSVKYLDLSWNSNSLSATILRRGTFNNLEFLEYLDLSGYTLEYIEENATDLAMLRFLNLSSNHLGDMGCKISDRFKNLPALIDLRLSDNKISCLYEDAFSDLRSIHTLDLSRNMLDTFNISLKQLTSLHMINLSYNYIHMFSKERTNEIDALTAYRNIEIDLSSNKLFCNCESVQFLKWIQTARIDFIGLENYKCVSNDNIVYLNNLQKVVDELERSCASHTVQLMLGSLGLAMVVSLISAALIYRYRWKIRYVYYMTRLQMRCRAKHTGYEQLFDYDAFVSYAADDHIVARTAAIENLEVVKGMKLCIHERDFQPGESIAYNISKGLHGSKCVLLFFSKAFLASEWCMYEMNIARMNALYKKRNNILVVILENIPRNEMSLEMMDFITTYTYLEYPMDARQEDVDVFWNKCVDYINGE